MEGPTFPLAAFARKGGAVQGSFDLMVENHVDEVWSALTQPGELVNWLAPGTIEPRIGGRVRIAFQDSGRVIDSTVSAFEPMRLLEYSWSAPGEPARPIRWELEPVGPETRLVLTVTVPKDEDAGLACAGWGAHVEMLLAALAGVPTAFPRNIFKAARELYGVEVAAL